MDKFYSLNLKENMQKNHRSSKPLSRVRMVGVLDSHTFPQNFVQINEF